MEPLTVQNVLLGVVAFFLVRLVLQLDRLSKRFHKMAQVLSVIAGKVDPENALPDLYS